MSGFTDEQVLDIRGGKSENPRLNALVKLAASITKKQGKTDAAIADDFFAQGYNNENPIDEIPEVADKVAMNYVHILTKAPVDFPLAPSLEFLEVSAK